MDDSKSQDILSALSDIGFFYLRAGVDFNELRRLEKVSRCFFSQSIEQKMRIQMSNAGRAWRGYFPLGAELTSGVPDQKEGIYFGREDRRATRPLEGRNQYPEIEGFAESVSAWMEKMQEVSLQILRIIAGQLNLPADYFDQRFSNEPTCLFRIFNYPSLLPKQQISKKRLRQGTVDRIESELSVGEHTDMGFLTILWQDNCGGLEVRDTKGQWIPVPPREDLLLVNVGDMLDFWTHGILRATPHRVKNLSSRDRLSIPFFFDPSWNANLQPIDRHQLDSVLLNTVDRPDRWDGLELRQLSMETTYGEYVWSKVKHVFPDLVG